MSYSQSQLNAIALTERVASVFSLLGCTFVILTFCFSPRFRKPVNRLILYAIFGNVAYAVGTLIADAGVVQGGDSALCQAQGFMIQAFLPADALWNLSMAMNVYVTVFKHYDTSQLRAREPFYHAVNYGIPIIVALVYCFISTPSNGKIYGDAIIWCWITEKWDYLRIATCYGPAWLCIIASFTIYVLAGMEIRKKRKLLRTAGGSHHSVKTTEFQVVSELADLGSSRVDSPDVGSPVKATFRDGQRSRNEFRSSRINFGSEYSVSVRGGNQHADVESSGHNRQRQRTTALEANTAAWRYTKCCLLFFSSLLITWLPSSVNRVFALVWPTLVPPFGLSYVASLVLPLTGFWNSVIYVTTSWSACKALVCEDIAPLFSRGEQWPSPRATAQWPISSRPISHEPKPMGSPQSGPWTGRSRGMTIESVAEEVNIGGRESPADSLAGLAGRAL